jgi:YHS domain-containing protein
MLGQLGKQALTIALWLLLAGAGLADSLVTTVVTDPLTGVAIDGLDPVTYFTGTEPQPGKPEYEYDWHGVPWYFVSAANRDVFMRNPSVYAPQFGGHCVTSLSRGYLSDGKPRLYVIDALKLYFFYSTANRDAYLMSKDATLKTATDNWPKLKQNLSGPGANTQIDAGADATAASSGGDSGETSSASVAPGGAAGNLGATTDSSVAEKSPNG